MKKLTEHDLMPFLGSKLKVKFKRSTYELTFKEYAGSSEMTLSRALKIQALPIMYPISCLTNTIEHEGRKFNPLLELMQILNLEFTGCPRYETYEDKILVTDGYDAFIYHLNHESFSFGKMSSEANNFDILYQTILPYKIFYKLAEWHINFVGIPEGLYIDKNTLK